MSKTRKNITISPRIEEVARRLMIGQGFDDFSGFVEHLIRQEHGKVFGTSIISDHEAPVGDASVDDTKRKRGRSRTEPDGL